MTRKQELYVDILEQVLPFMRNIQRQTTWRRLRYGSFYPEAELVHNLPRLLVIPNFTEYDVYWLNSQARLFTDDGDNPVHSFYKPVTACISELFTLVPEPLKGKLTWQGPKKGQ